jgi:hypothetical protein
VAHGAALSVVPGALGGVPGRWRCRLSLRALSAPAGRRPLLCCRLPCPHGARCREHPTEGAAATGSRLPIGERRAGIRRSAHPTEGRLLTQKERGDARRGMVRRGHEGVPTEWPSPGAPALWSSRELLTRLATPAAQGRAGGEARRPRGQGGPWPGSGPRTGPPCLRVFRLRCPEDETTRPPAHWAGGLLLNRDRPGCWSGSNRLAPAPTGLDATNLYAVLPWGEITGALPLYPI